MDKLAVKEFLFEDSLFEKNCTQQEKSVCFPVEYHPLLEMLKTDASQILLWGLTSLR